MTVKFSRSALAYVSAPDNANLTLPAGDWTISFGFVLDGATTGNSTQYFVSTGNYQEVGGFNLFWSTFDATNGGKLAAYISTGGSPSCLSPVLEAGKAYHAFFEHNATAGSVNVFVCPVLTALPTTGSAVLAGTNTASLSGALDGPRALVFGTRATIEISRSLDHSAGRFFVLPSILTALEKAKIAYGMEVAELGYTPSWYCRLNDATDFADRGSLGVPFAKTGTLAAGTAMGYGYVPTTSAPAFTSAPTIDGTPQVGSTVTYSRGAFTGTPVADVTQQWYVAGIAVAGATGSTYIPATADAAKALGVRQILNNSQGSTYSDSATKTVAAAANAIALTALPAEKIYPRNGTTAAVALAGTYTGTQPSSIEYQLYAIDGLTVRQAWAAAAANIVAGGTWSAAPLMPQHLEKYTIAVRAKDSGGAVLSTSVISTNRFGVGFNIAPVGSSTVATWFGSGSGGSFTPNTASTSYCDASGFRNFDANGVISQAAAYLAAQFGCCVGMINIGISGETITSFATQGSGPYNLMVSNIALAGNRLEGLWCSAGSNDASNNYLVTSVAQHLAKLRAVISTVRTQCNQPNMPVLWAGMNPRPGSQGNAAGQDPISDWVRQAETILGDDANVYSVQCIDYAPGGDGVHLTGAGFQAQVGRIQYVWVEAVKNGVYHRGPKITSFTFLGNEVTATIQYRNGSANDFTPTTGAIGFTVTDANGSLGIVSVTRKDATHPKITCDRTLVAPVVTKYLSGGAPSTAAPIFDNGSVPLPLTMDSILSTTEGAAPVDSQAPTLTNASATQTGSTTASGSVATDEASGTLYFLVSTTASATASQVKSGSSQAVTVAGVKTVNSTGLSPATAQYFYFLHRDAAGNDSEVLRSPIFTTSSEAPQQGNGQSGITFIPSIARTLKVKAAALTFEGGAFWDLTIPRKPSGRKDPDSVIDITLDWSDVLTDISDTIASIDWAVKNAASAGSYPAGVLTTLFVSGGMVSTVIEITATMTTASNPPRKEDRTVYLKVEQL